MNRLHKYLYFAIRRAAARHKPHPDPEMSSLADVAFLLLIFFIVTSSFALNEGIFFKLPSPAAGISKVDKEKLVEVTPEESGFSVDGEVLDEGELRELLKERREADPEVIAVIYMKPQIRYERLVDTLSLIKVSRLERVSVKSMGEL